MIGIRMESSRQGDAASLAVAAMSFERSLERLVAALLSAGRELRQARVDYQALLDAARKAGRDLPTHATFGCLTRQERRVALLAAAGNSDAKVAAATYVSVHTVKTHMKNVLRKLRLHSRWQLAQLLADTPESDFAMHRPVFHPSRDGQPGRSAAD